MKAFKKTIISISALSLGYFGIVSTSSARMNIEPLIITGYEYHSNFWRSEVDGAGVDTFYVKPGVKFGYETGKTVIDIDFLIEGYVYHDQDTPADGVRDADEDNYVGLFGDLSWFTQVTDRVGLTLDEVASYTRDASQSDVFSDSIEREKYFINRFTPGGYYDFGNKFSLGASYQNTYTNYEDDGEDSTENMGLFNFYYNLNERMSTFISYDIWTRDYDQGSETYLSNRVKLNYTHQFNNFELQAGAGYHNRDFDDPSFEDLDLFSWNISLEGQDPPAPEEDPRAHMLVAFSQDMNDAGAGNSYFTATRVDVEVGYLFLERIITEINGYYQNSDYETYLGSASDREDQTYSVSGIIGYKFLRRGKVNFELGYNDRDSSLAGRSYSDTFGMLSLEFGLDLGVL